MRRILPALAVACLLTSTAACAEKAAPPADDGAGQVMCTMEAKICPDGTGVGRTGPKCEFAPCPGEKPGTTPPATGGKPDTPPPAGDSAPGATEGSEGGDGVEDVPGSYE